MKPAAVTLVIGPGNVLQDADALRCEPDSRIAFVIFNADDSDHQVWIEPGEIVLKSDRAQARNPLVDGKHVLTIQSGDVKILKQKIKPLASFGKAANQLPYTTYKYTLWSADPGGANPTAFDPDMDVCPPS